MSLIGFKAQNHPQQDARDDVDDFDYDKFQYAQLSKRYITASAGNAFTMRR